MDLTKKAFIDEAAEKIFDKHRDQIDLIESNRHALGQVRSIDSHDLLVVGEMLEAAEHHYQMIREAEGANTLGRLPLVAKDVIAVGYANSVMPMIASVQPLEEVQGIVYFKKVLANGQTLADPRQPGQTPVGLAQANAIGADSGQAGDGAATTFAIALGKAIRKESVKVYAADDASTYAYDADGSGELAGKQGAFGTVDYLTGAVSVTFPSAPANGIAILIDYQTDVERGDIPEIDLELDSRLVKAHPYALKGVWSMLQQFAGKKRHGMSWADDVSKELVAQMNREVGGQLISLIKGNAVGLETFYKKPGAGYSPYAQRQELDVAIANAGATIYNNAGRGDVSVIIAGRLLCAYLKSLDKFKQAAGVVGQYGPHLYGTYDGIPVIRDSERMGDYEATCLYKGSNWDAAGVWAPYMPLTTTDNITTGRFENPLTSQKAVCQVAAVESIQPKFATSLVMNVNDPQP